MNRLRLAALAGVLLLPGCRKPTPEELLVEAGATHPSGAELRSALAGNTAHGLNLEPRFFVYLFYGTDGTLVGKVGRTFAAARSAEDPSVKDVGTWRIAEDGTLCLRWAHWLNGAESCLRVYRAGKKYEGYSRNGVLTLSLRVDPGKPPGF